MQRTKLADRVLPSYTKGEEIFNMTSHILGSILGIVATIMCVILSVKHNNNYSIVGSSIYGFTLILLYTVSSLYHGISPKLKAKKILQILDHCSIFLLIAGCYTPIALTTIKSVDEKSCWLILSIVWGAALLGIIFNSIDLESTKKFSLICYLLMGWCIIFKFNVLLKAMPIQGIILLVLGGLSYTFGTIFYVLGKKKKYFHSIFHLFILLGSLLQFFLIIFYVV